MANKNHIDFIRNSGGSVMIGTDKDGSIEDIFEFEGKLFVIKEKAIYEFVHADKIDPERDNASLPNGIQRVVINKGSKSEIVSRTFLTARKLLKVKFFPDTIDIRKILSLFLDLLMELDILDREIKRYLRIERKEIINYKSQKGIDSSFSIPSISNVLTRCKTIFQKADHIEQILMEINSLFFPDFSLNKQSQFPKLHQCLKNKYGNDDDFTKFISDSLIYLELIKGFRNCLDHRLPNAKVYDFKLLASAELVSPSIEIDYRQNKMERTSISSFLPVLSKNLIFFIENILAFLADKNIISDKLPKRVSIVPQKLRINRYVKFGFWSPLGDGGFFHQ